MANCLWKTSFTANFTEELSKNRYACVYIGQRSLENLKPMICKSPPVHETRSSHETIYPARDRSNGLYIFLAHSTHFSFLYYLKRSFAYPQYNVRNHVRVTAAETRTLVSTIYPPPRKSGSKLLSYFSRSGSPPESFQQIQYFSLRGRNSESTRGCINANNFLGSFYRNFAPRGCYA